MNKLTKQRNARCTAHAVFNAVEELLGRAPEWTPDDLWDNAKTFFKADKVSEDTGTQLWRILFVVSSFEKRIVFPRHSEVRQFTGDELGKIERGMAVAIIGTNLHALAVIDARKSWLGYWQILVEGSDGKPPRWWAVWRYSLSPMEIAILRHVDSQI